MSHPDEYGRRAEPVVAPFPKKWTEEEPSRPSPSDLEDGILLIAKWMCWLTYNDMMELAKSLMGNDYKPPASPNEMAELLHRWAKAKTGHG